MPRLGRYLVNLVPFVVVSFLTAPSWAKPGDLDSSFSGDGKVTTSFRAGPSEVHGLVIQSDGKIVAAGVANRDFGDSRFALARYKSNGSLDGTFSHDGKVTTNFTAGDDPAYEVAALPGGRIVAAGTAGGKRFGVARYWGNGTLDHTFGGDGKVTTNFERGSDRAFGVVIQADKKILAAGRVAGSGGRFGLARYNGNGSLDTTFGGDGKVGTNFTTRNDFASDVAIQADGKIVAVGRAGSYQYSNGMFALARYNPDGTLDSTFGGGGKVVTDFPGSDEFALGLALQPDGKIVAVGSTQSDDPEPNLKFALARYKTDGSLDPSFGDGGTVATDIHEFAEEQAEAVAIQPDGKLVLAVAGGDPDSGFGVLRYSSEGSLDLSFGDGGMAFVDFKFIPAAYDVALQSDGRIVAAGTTNSVEIDTEFAAARFLSA